MSAESREDERKRETGPLAWMAKNSVAANLIMLVLLIGGALMMSRVKQEVFPEFDLDLVMIQVPYPGASPAEVEQGVVLAIEEAVRGLDDVKEVRSTATEGMGVVAVELMLGANADRALADIKSAVDRITSFPEDIERPVVSLATLRRQVVSLVIYGDKSEAELRRLAERTRDELLDLPEITYVELDGVRPLEISVEVPQENLRRYGLTIDQVARTIRASSVEIPGGGVKTRSGEVLLRTSERRDRGSEFEEIVLLSRPDGSQVRVRDIARVTDAFREMDQEALFNGKRAVMVNVFRVGDETPIESAEAVKRYMEQNRERFPSGVELAIWNDASEIYADRVDLLMRNAMAGLVLVLLTLGLFLEVRLAFWVTLGIPVSFVGSLLFLPATDVSVNMISLFAFILTLGMVVDDAIVVGEAVYKRRQDGMKPLAAAISGVREVAGPVVFSILTTCIAFMPLVFVPGTRGKFFVAIPTVVITVLLISLAESLFVLPAHLAHTGEAGNRGLGGWLHRQQQKVSRLLEWLIDRTYRPVLLAAIRWRYLTVAAGLMILIGTLGLWVGGRIEFTFMPKIESDIVNASLEMPFGTAVEDTRDAEERLLAAARETLAELGGEERYARGVFSQIGSAGGGSRGPAGSGSSSGSHLAQVTVQLVPAGEREFTAAELVRRWREKVGDVPGAESLRYDYSTGSGGGQPIDIELTHPDMETLERAAERLAAAMAEYHGVRDVDDGFTPGKEQLDLRLRPEARSLGVTESELARQVRAAFFGAEAVRQQRGRDEIRAYVRRPLSERTSMHDVERMIILTPQGGEVPLGQAAVVERGHSYTQIKRTDGRRVINVTADVVPGEANANKVVADLIRDVIPDLQADYPRLGYAMGGEQKSQAETMGALLKNFGMAVIAMLALLAVAFRSYAQPLIVMGAIPFGFVGALIGHVMMGYDLSLLSMMGVVALSGVVVNSSLILVVAVNEYRADGMTMLEGLEAGGTRRFRPILLTSLTTFLGLAPMIAETSVQARFLIPMAISLGFGVLFATLITLLIVPASYAIVEDVKRQVRAGRDFVWGSKDSPVDTPATED